MSCPDCEMCTRKYAAPTTQMGVYDSFCSVEGILIRNIERCPWPSKRVEKKDKYDVAWDNYRASVCRVDFTHGVSEDMFKEACKKAGLV